MKVIIAGPRDFIPTPIEVSQAVASSGFDVNEVVCGGARGVDEAGAEWGNDNGIPVEYFPAQWNLHGRGAGHIRNRQMALYADALLIIKPEGDWTKGTYNMYATMGNLRPKPRYVYVVK